ncbi:Uma2 family endonuclease [bacterium]|nr:Uma2 family endonuclease [bacterium]
MSPVEPPPRFANLAELLDDLGGVAPDRVCYDPPPGRATKADLIRLHEVKLYELVDGTLVEKPMGRPESYLAFELGRVLGNFVHAHDLGFVTGADDLIEVRPDIVRGPDVSFTSWLKRPDRTVGSEAIAQEIPDLAVEVLSRSNTPKEIARKLGEYFRGGVRVVWVIDHRRRAADVYTAPGAKVTVAAAGALDGGDVLPGFRLPLAELFAKFPADPGQ